MSPSGMVPATGERWTFRRCQWCGHQADTDAHPERCPDCRAPWPAIGNAVGLEEKPQQLRLEVDGQERAPWV